MALRYLSDGDPALFEPIMDHTYAASNLDANGEASIDLPLFEAAVSLDDGSAQSEIPVLQKEEPITSTCLLRSVDTASATLLAESVMENVVQDPGSSQSRNCQSLSQESSQASGLPRVTRSPRKSPASYREEELYRIGDYCYFETSASGPYQIRRLEELIRNENRGIDVRCLIYSRKSDLPPSVQRQISGYIDGEEDFLNPSSASCSYDPAVNCRLRRRHLNLFSRNELLDHYTWSRELIINRDSQGPMSETLPTSLIRGRCHVLHHLDGLGKREFAERENTFFAYRSFYPPEGEEDKGPGQIAIEKEKDIQYDLQTDTYQATIPPCSPTPPDSSTPNYATLIWAPDKLPDDTVTSFLTITAAVNLLSRCRSDSSPTSLVLTQPASMMAKVASRDHVHEMAYRILHESGYDLRRAVEMLVGDGKARGERDLVERWDEEDLAYFRGGLVGTERDLAEVYSQWMPWKSLGEVVRFYYLYKGSDLYNDFKVAKAVDRRAQGHISCLHIAHMESKSCLLKNVSEAQTCYACTGSSSTWYAWVGLSRTRGQIRAVCKDCWIFWKRYACLKRPWKKPASISRNGFTPSPQKMSSPPVTEHNRTSSVPHSFHLQTLVPTKPLSVMTVTKSLMLTHKSPPPPEVVRRAVSPQKGKRKKGDEDFVFKAGSEWTLARRVASESLYVPRQVALFPELPTKDADQVDEYARSCPGLVVSHYQQQPIHKRRRSGIMEQMITKISQLHS